MRIRLGLTIITLLTLLCLLVTPLGTLADSGETRGDLAARFAREEKVDSEGNVWVKRNNLTTILALGIDQRPNQDTSSLRNGGQADFLMLIVLDEDAKTITPLQIDRDTMAEIVTVGVLGNISGTRIAQICLAHGFGDGKQQSNDFTAQAVSKLLDGVDIDFVFSMNMDGIATFNDAIGGVTVTVTDDLSALDPELYVGNTLKLTGEQAHLFVRSRKTVGNGTNEERESRQKVYLKAAAELVMQKISKNKNFIGSVFDAIEDYSVTDMKRGRMINIAWGCRDYTVNPIQKLEGTYAISSLGFMEFAPDKASIEKTVLELFYEPKE